MSRTKAIALLLLAIGLCGRAAAQGPAARDGTPAKRPPRHTYLGAGYKPAVVSTSFLLRLPGVREEIGLSEGQGKVAGGDPGRSRGVRPGGRRGAGTAPAPFGGVGRSVG